MFFIFFCIAVLVIYIFLIIISNLKVEIYNTNFSTEKIQGSYFSQKYKIFLSFCIGKFKLFRIKFTEEKLQSKGIKKNVDKIKKKMKQDQNYINISLFRIIKESKIKIEKINLDINIGIEDAEATAILVGGISGVIANLLRGIEDKYFLISPVYGKNILKINIESIITVKVIHIIYMIYILQKIRRKENVRTSNRRSYANSYE